ncbi:RlpA-like double-psi beta-barrel-protein domain-containing protein-containing protein [Lentinula detonsa]|uniref:RlpA-like double-psi beta-barrel-protein domain-containing protein-containing protein n=1 Tax=Lentinula detonsa TaxID=2804962 RepID=A0A9W8TVE1_9AGAR|nr:RlpA-like double-psi beta-barrel-protein domain-containing protein-containing protein [Lentinula detonsa]
MSKFSRQSLFCILFSLCAFYLVSASHDFDPLLHRRHTLNANLAKREAASFRKETSLEKRFDNSRFTYYADGLGACGQTNQPSDFIVALNSAQYNGGQYCFQMITITVGDKSTQAQIMDECPGCPYGGLDFSEGLFQYFASLDEGVLTGSWNFDSGATSTSETPTSTYTPPTSTWTPAPSTSSTSTSTWTPTSTSTWSSSSTSLSSSYTSSSASTSTASSSSASSLLSSSSSSTATTSTASATPTVVASSGVFGMLEVAVMQMGLVAASGAGATSVA